MVEVYILFVAEAPLHIANIIEISFVFLQWNFRLCKIGEFSEDIYSLL